jgi:hypothetical protein
MGRQLLLGALRHADGREMKVSRWQAFRVLVVDVTFKVCVTGGHGHSSETPSFHQINLLLTNNTATSPCYSALGNTRKWIIKH